MKAKLVLDQDVHVAAAAEKPGYVDKIRWVARKGYKRPVAIYPKGTEFDGDHALFLCSTGQAHPSDEECLKATGKTEPELRAIQAAYHLTQHGYNKQDDRDLALAGVILGYDEEGKPIPGPNWAQYQSAVAADEQDDEI